MLVSNSKIKVQKILKDYKINRLNFELKIQRSEDIWDKPRRSKMIHSILIKWPTNSIFAAKEKNILSIIDGKQRLTTVISFLSDKFPLDKDTPNVNGVEVKGLTYSQLPEDLQNIILEYQFDFTIIQEATLDEIEELFSRWNSGMPMRKIETNRAILGGKVLKLVEDVANTPFFQTKANISNTAKKHFLDQELVLQILILIQHEDTGFSGKEIENFVRELRNQRIQDELKSKMQNASFYLNQVFLKKEKFLRKNHIPMLFKIVLEMQEKALVITPKQFEEWVRSFFDNMPEEYKKASNSKTAQKQSVQTRYRIMKEDFQKFFDQQL